MVQRQKNELNKLQECCQLLHQIHELYLSQDETNQVEKGAAIVTGNTDTGLYTSLRSQNHLQPGQPRRQKVVRRPLVQLQQVGQAGRQHHRPFDSSNQAQAISAHRCGKSCLSESPGKFSNGFFKKVSQEQHPYPFPRRRTLLSSQKNKAALSTEMHLALLCVRLLKQMDFFYYNNLSLALLLLLHAVVKVRRVSYFMQVPLSKLRKH